MPKTKSCQKNNLKTGEGSINGLGLASPKIILALFLFLALNTPAYAEIKASWYSIQSLIEEGTWKNGKERRMANGERFNDSGFTCATRLFALGTMLRITNSKSGKTVVVKVTDRISKRFARTRIDLSKGAFGKIANLDEGVIQITVERLT